MTSGLPECVLNLMCPDSTPHCNFDIVTTEEDPDGDSRPWHCVTQCSELSIGFYTGFLGCIPKKQPGKFCVLNDACISGNCRWFSCDDLQEEGDDCESHFNCESGHCDVDEEECVPALKNGADCSETGSAACESKTCGTISEICVTQKGIGGSCPAAGGTVACESGWCDSDNKCTATKPLNAACSEDYQCDSAFCKSSKCSSRSAVNADCSAYGSRQCSTGYCGSDDKCGYPAPERRLGAHHRLVHTEPHWVPRELRAAPVVLAVPPRHTLLLVHEVAGGLLRRLGAPTDVDTWSAAGMGHGARLSVRVTVLRPHPRRHAARHLEPDLLTIGEASAPDMWVATSTLATPAATIAVTQNAPAGGPGHSSHGKGGGSAAGASALWGVRARRAVGEGAGAAGATLDCGHVGTRDALRVEVVLLSNEAPQDADAAAEAVAAGEGTVVGTELYFMAGVSLHSRECSGFGCRDTMNMADPRRYAGAVVTEAEARKWQPQNRNLGAESATNWLHAAEASAAGEQQELPHTVEAKQRQDQARASAVPRWLRDLHAVHAYGSVDLTLVHQ